jgi:hypothetical protein
MASRGAVYKDRAAAVVASTAKRTGKEYHDNCRCTVQPIFRRGTPLSPAGDHFKALYKDHGSLNDVRRHLDGRPPKTEEKTNGGDSAG